MRTAKAQHWKGQIQWSIKRALRCLQCKNAFRVTCVKLGSFRKPINLFPAEILQLGIRKQQFVYTSGYELTGVWKWRNESHFCDRVPWNFRANKFSLKKNYTVLSLLVYKKTELDLQVNKESMFTNWALFLSHVNCKIPIHLLYEYVNLCQRDTSFEYENSSF